MRAAILLATLIGCTKPQEAVVEIGGRAPVFCLCKDDRTGLFFCRDAGRKLFVCTSADDSECISFDEIMDALIGTAAGKAEVEP